MVSREVLDTPGAPPATESAAIASTRQHVETMSRSAYVDYPAWVVVETYTNCNAACSFCVYPTLPRIGTRMPEAMFEKIVEDLSGIPTDLPFLFYFGHVNEPFLDHRLFDLVALALRRLPNAWPVFVSNGSTLVDKVIHRLAALPRLYELTVSLNDHRPGPYREAMRLDQARVLARLDRLHAIVEAGGADIPVRISRVGDGTPVDREFVEWVAHRYPRFKHYVHTRSDWIGGAPPVSTPVPDVGCRHWFELVIHANGRVAYCCMDGEQKHATGDASRDNVLAIYNQARLRRTRVDPPSRLAFAPCDSCNIL